jgi:UDP-2,3-diacylglucosamine hydrolase
MEKILGIIAGSGQLPNLLLGEAKKEGYRVALCAIKGEANSALLDEADASEWIRLGELGRMINFFKREGVQGSVMGGKITKTNLFRGHVRPDLEMIKVIAKTKNHSDDSLLGGIAEHLKACGMPLLNTTDFLSEYSLPKAGVLTRRKPSEKENKDIQYGWHLAKEMGRLDIGQTVVVKNQAILAVEAIEGTDEAILRGGALGNGDATVVKVAKPKQDLRFDVPAVGLTTLESMIRARAKVLAIEADSTILLDRKEFIDQANANRISVVARN